MTEDHELIDNTELINHVADLKFSHGANLGITARVFAGIMFPLFFYLFVASIITGVYIGTGIALLFLTPILWALTARSGVQICERTQFFKEYSTFVGFKFGKWKTSKGMPDVAILTIRKNQQISSGFGSNAMNVENVETGVYFLTPSHRKRILITICASKSAADKVTEELALSLKKTIRVFKPKISEATKNRRR